MTRSLTWLLGGLLVAVLATGCQEPISSSTDQDAAREQILRRGNGGDPGTLDPALAQDVHAFNVLVDLYEGLVSEGPDGSVVAGVAESWVISDDGRRYEFALRPDAKWSNGEPVVALDFVRAFRRVAEPGTESAYSFLLEPLENFEAVNAGEKPASELGIEAIHERLLVIRLNRSASYFLSILAMPIASPLHENSLEETLGKDGRSLVSNGAYTLKSRQILGPIELLRNPYYWGAESVSIDRVVYLPIVNESSELDMYRAGEIDITDSVPTHDLARLMEKHPGEVRIAPKLALYYVAFDLSEAPFDNKELRTALSMAIDREQIIRLTGRGESPAYGIVPPGVANHVGATYKWRDLESSEREERAREAFRAAGYGAENPLRIKLTYDTGDIHERIALAVTGMWRDVLGVETELEKLEWKYFLSTRENRGAWDTMRFAWFGDYNDPMTFAEIFRADSPQNLPQYKSDEYDEILDSAMVELDTARRLEQMTRAEQILLDDYPIAPLYFFVGKHLVKPHVRGFEDNVLDRHPSRFLSLSGAER